MRFGGRYRIRGLAPLALFLGSGALPCHWAAGPVAAVHAQGVSAQEVRISLVEWALVPPAITTIAGRPVRFLAANDGALPHALAVEGTGFYAETATIGSGAVERLELIFTAPGVYDLYCPVAAGQHRALGQEGVLTVLPASAGPLLPRTGDATAGDATAAEDWPLEAPGEAGPDAY